MKNKIKIAMVLAAGFGNRMKKLTAQKPKPLLPIANTTLLEMILTRLRNAGIERVVINLHYLGNTIKAYLKDKKYSRPEIIFSGEKEILGTGGGIAKAEPFFQDETILVVNSDVICTIPIRKMIQSHSHADGIATMAVVPSQKYRQYSLVLFDETGKLHGFSGKNKLPPGDLISGIFTGYQILTPEARRYLRPEFSSVITHFYRPALQQKERINIFLHHGKWFDVGTKERYLRIRNQFENDKLDFQDFL